MEKTIKINNKMKKLSKKKYKNKYAFCPMV